MKLDIGKVWLEGAEDGRVRRVLGVGAHGICNIKRQNVLNWRERKRRILWLLNHLAKQVGVLKWVGPWQP